MLALAGMVFILLCVVVFIHGASVSGSRGRTTLNIGREPNDGPRHENAA